VPNDMYELFALIPSTSDFSIDGAVAHFDTLTFGKTRLRSEAIRAEGHEPVQGFRVHYEDWSITAWLDESAGVIADSQHLAAQEPLPTDHDAIARCSKRLSIISDEDPELNHSDEITHFTDALRKLNRLFVWDPVNAEWW